MNNVFIIVGFVLFLFVLCIVWNRIMMFQYKKNAGNRPKLLFETDINSIDISLVANEIDGNTDNKFAQAVKKIELPENLRVKIYE